MSDTNRVGLRIAKSSAKAFPVTLSPNELTALRITGTPSLAFQPQTVTSNEIRPDRQVSDLIAVGAEAGGDVGFELSFGTFDDVIESALFSSWVNTPQDVGTTGITATGAGTITVDDGTIYKADMIVRLLDTTGTNLGEGVYIIDSIATNVLTVSPFNSDTNAVDGSVVIGAASMLKVVGYHTSADGEFNTTVSNGIVTLTASGGSDFDDLMGSGVELAAGQWIKLSGFTATNSVWARIIARTTTTITFLQASGVTAESPTGASQIWFGDYVINGSEDISSHEYLIERRFEDHSPITRETFLGMAINQLNLQLEPQSIATGTITFFGTESEVSDASGSSYDDLYAALPTDIAASDEDVYNTSSNVGRIGRGASEVDAGNANFVTQASIEVNNNLRRLPAVGVFGAAAVGVGEFSVTGSLNAYFDDKSLLEAVLNSTDTSFDMTVVSGDKRTMTFDLPRIRFSDGAPQVPGKNQDVTINLSYQALLDSTLNHTLLVQRGYYAV